MSRRPLRIISCSLLGLAFLLCPGTLLPQTRYQLPVYEQEPFTGLRREVGRVNLALNASFKDAQGNWRRVTGRWRSEPCPTVASPFGPLVQCLGMPGEDEIFGSSVITDRSILSLPPGSLVPVPGGVNSCAASAGVVADPLGRFVLTTNSVQNRVCVHRSDPETGALTPVTGSPFSTVGTSPGRLAIGPAGAFVFVANTQSNNVTVFSLDLDTGALSAVPGSPFAAGSQPLDVATDGFGRFLYVTNSLSNSISAFSINRSNGVLTPIAGSPFSMGNFPHRVEADPLGRFLYAIDSRGVSVLSIGPTGALTLAAGSPLALNPGPSALAVDPSGQFLMVTQRTSFIGQNDTVASYRVSSNGSLTPVGSPVSLGEGASPVAVAVDPGGQWVYVVNSFFNPNASQTYLKL